MRRKVLFIVLCGVVAMATAGMLFLKKYNYNTHHVVGEVLDSLNGVYVYYNGGVDHVSERHVKDGYNLGLKYQCVEFVKRYYYERLHHKMPDSYGHAKDFFDARLKDGERNLRRNLIQYTNGSATRPRKEDLLVFEGSVANRYGHVAIVSQVSDTEIEIIQQNPGPFGKSRVRCSLRHVKGKWRIDNDRLLGWLRKG